MRENRQLACQSILRQLQYHHLQVKKWEVPTQSGPLQRAVNVVPETQNTIQWTKSRNLVIISVSSILLCHYLFLHDSFQSYPMSTKQSLLLRFKTTFCTHFIHITLLTSLQSEQIVNFVIFSILPILLYQRPKYLSSE